MARRPGRIRHRHRRRWPTWASSGWAWQCGICDSPPSSTMQDLQPASTADQIGPRRAADRGLTLAMDVDLDTVDLRDGPRRISALRRRRPIGLASRCAAVCAGASKGLARRGHAVGAQSGIRPDFWLDGHYTRATRRGPRIRVRHARGILSRRTNPALVPGRAMSPGHMAVRLGELLLREKRISPGQLQEALNHQRTHGGRLGPNLVKLGIRPRRRHHGVARAASTASPRSTSPVRSRPRHRPARAGGERLEIQGHSRRPDGHDADAGDGRPDQRLRHGRREVHDGAARRSRRRVGERGPRRHRHGTTRTAARRPEGRRIRPRGRCRTCRSARSWKSSPRRRRLTRRRSSGRGARRRSSGS